MSSNKPTAKPAEEINDNVLTLAKPIMTIDGEVRQLKFREATGADYLQLGSPVTYEFDADGNAKPNVNEKVALKYVTLLTGIDETGMKQMRPKDLMLAGQMAVAVVMSDDPS
jgi:hypothetical protein